MIVSMVIAHYGARGRVPVAAHVPILIIVAILSLLMVSTVRYRTFKDVRLSKKSASVFMLICATGVVIATQLHPAYVLLAYFSMYLVLGIIESGVLLKNHLAARKLAASTAAGPLLSSEEDEDEDADDVDEQDVL
jgi:CDP-diacylglycerol--serine O-phosphatidyltransferase